MKRFLTPLCLTIGVVANRLPSIGYRYDSGFQLTDIDPLTGVQNYPEIRYDLTGHPYNAPPGTELAGQTLAERFVRVALAKGRCCRRRSRFVSAATKRAPIRRRARAEVDIGQSWPLAA